MAPQKLRQIKREIRVLGVAARCDPRGYSIVGVVYRGNLWLDGVLKAHSIVTHITEPIAEMLLRSPHLGQVRVILASRAYLPAEVIISTAELYARTGKPVIILGDSLEATGLWRSEGEKVGFSVEGLSRWSAIGVLKASTREGIIPEALRVAALTLSALPDGVDT